MKCTMICTPRALWSNSALHWSADITGINIVCILCWALDFLLSILHSFFLFHYCYPVDMKVYARFDEITSLTLQDTETNKKKMEIALTFYYKYLSYKYECLQGLLNFH